MCDLRSGGALNLKLTVYVDRLSVTILNSSSQEVKLWDLHTSFGWPALSVQIRAEAKKPVQISRRWRDWTKNGPVYFILLPKEEVDVVLDLHDSWWDARVLPEWKDRPVSVRARLQIKPTPESERFGVFTGIVCSDWISSAPPHGWLFAVD